MASLSLARCAKLGKAPTEEVLGVDPRTCACSLAEPRLVVALGGHSQLATRLFFSGREGEGRKSGSCQGELVYHRMKCLVDVAKALSIMDFWKGIETCLDSTA